MITLEEFQRIRATEHLIVLDTTILLELYRKPANISLDIIKAFKEIVDRIYVPRQVYDEYLRNYHKVSGNEKGKYQKVGTELSGPLTKLQEEITSRTTEYRKHDYTDITKLQSDLGEKLEEIRNILKEYENSHRKEIEKNKDFLRHDKVKEFIDLLVEHGNIGNPFPFSKRLLILQEGKIRFENLIPPGYEDYKKDGAARYGDLFIWKNIIEVAKERNVNILFVCNDVKGDWWERDKESPIELRRELLEEFKEINPLLKIHFLTMNKFFSYIAEELQIGQSKSALQLSAMDYVEKNLVQYDDVIESEVGNFVASINVDDMLGGEYVSDSGDEKIYWSIKDVSVDKQDKDIFYYIDLDVSILGDSICTEDEENSCNVGKVAVALDGKVKLRTEEYSEDNQIDNITMELAEVFYIKPEVWKVIKRTKENATCREIIAYSKGLIKYEEDVTNHSNNLESIKELGAVLQKFAESCRLALEPLPTDNYAGLIEAIKPLTEAGKRIKEIDIAGLAEALEPIARVGEIINTVDTVKIAETLKPFTSVKDSISKLDTRGEIEAMPFDTNTDGDKDSNNEK